MEHLFPDLPDDLSALSDEDVARELDARRETLRRIRERDEELIGERSRGEVRDEALRGVEQVEALASALAERESAAAEADAELDEILARVPEPDPAEPAPPGEPADDPTDEPGDPGQPDAPGDADDGSAGDPDATPSQQREPVTASVGRILRRRPPAPRDDQRAPDRHVEITAATTMRGITAGDDLSLRRYGVAEAIIEASRTLGRTVPEADGQPFHIGQIKMSYPNERQLTGDPQNDQVKIDALVRSDDLAEVTASGGLCAPVTVLYDQPVFAQADRPVRDSLPTFNAVRGGIRYAPPPTLASIDTTGGTGAAVKRITAAADLAGGAGATKPCQRITCPSFVEVDVAAISRCLIFGNLGSRAWPEQVDAATQLLMAAWARFAETSVLDAIKAASTAVTDAATASTTAAGTAASAGAGATLGAYGELVASVIKEAAAFRSRHRLDENYRLDVYMPEWVPDLLVSDAIRSQFYRYANEVSRAGVEADLAARAVVRVIWYDDGPSTGTGQVFGAGGATVVDFPADVQWCITHPGAFLWLDAGEINFGIVRDSTLNATNDYQLFAESFENVAFIGLESRWITSAVADTGATGGPVLVPTAG